MRPGRSANVFLLLMLFLRILNIDQSGSTSVFVDSAPSLKQVGMIQVISLTEKL